DVYKRQTGELANDPDVTNAVIRAFATQFLPEAQRETAKWAGKSLRDVVNELAKSLESGDESYSLGLYSESGGHAVLPYEVQFFNNDLVQIRVYDSNWPGQVRVVDVDFRVGQWRFSFAGVDPANDPCAWTGGDGDMDLTPLSARLDATCPFCADKARTKSSMLLIRSTTRNWAITTSEGTYSPSDPTPLAGVVVRPLRAADCSNVVVNPEYLVSAESEEVEISLPDPASVFVVNDTSVVELVTDTGAEETVTVSPRKVASKDKKLKVTVTSGDLAVEVKESTPTIEIAEETLQVIVPDEQGVETVVEVTQEVRQVEVVGGGSGAPEVKEVALNSVQPQTPAVLAASEAKPELPPVPERITVGIAVSATTTSVAESTTTSSTVAAAPTTSTVAATSTTTTTVGASTTAAPVRVTTTVPRSTTSSSTTSSTTSTTTSTTTTTVPPTTTTVPLTTTTTTTTVPP
ncbi:MAG: hypothetical protein EBY92_08440, partial [Actinobacteria bacterium]|nr:hypothetical protein [Actinomycetota bacterium]